VTYLQFLVVFLALPIIGLLVALRRQGASVPWLAIGAVCLMALAYTTPWDNALIANGVWTYPAQRVLGVVLGVVPIEEYGFFVLQTILAGLLTAVLTQRLKPRLGG